MCYVVYKISQPSCGPVWLPKNVPNSTLHWSPIKTHLLWPTFQKQNIYRVFFLILATNKILKEFGFGKKKMKVLCLHGFRANKDLMEHQIGCLKIKTSVEFVYINGPHRTVVPCEEKLLE